MIIKKNKQANKNSNSIFSIVKLNNLKIKQNSSNNIRFFLFLKIISNLIDKVSQPANYSSSFSSSHKFLHL